MSFDVLSVKVGDWKNPQNKNKHGGCTSIFCIYGEKKLLHWLRPNSVWL